MAKTKYDPFGDTIEQKEKPKKEPKPAQREYLNRTLTIREDHLEKLRAKAYWDRTTQKEVLDEALEAYFKGKKIKEFPKGE